MQREWCKLETEVGETSDSDKLVMTLKVADLAMVLQKSVRTLSNLKIELYPYRRAELSLEEISWI